MLISRLNLVKKNWIMYLLSLLILEHVNMVFGEKDAETNNHGYLKNLLLRTL